MEEMRKCREAESFKENARRKNQMVKEGERECTLLVFG